MRPISFSLDHHPKCLMVVGSKDDEVKQNAGLSKEMQRTVRL